MMLIAIAFIATAFADHALPSALLSFTEQQDIHTQQAATNRLRRNPKREIAAWGDSLTAGPSSGNWPRQLADLRGLDVFDGGVGGSSLWQVAARQSALPIRLTIAGNEIPASGSAIVTRAYENPFNGTSTEGSLSGVPGVLGKNTFTRLTPGRVTFSAPNSLFVPSSAQLYNDRTLLIQVDRNSATTLDGVYATPAEHIAIYKKIIAAQKSQKKRFLIWQCPPRNREKFGSDARRQYDKLMNAVERDFPNSFVRVGDFLRSDEAAKVAGIIWTEQDKLDIAEGVTPRSFHKTATDDVHLNDLAGKAVAYYINRELNIRNW